MQNQQVTGAYNHRELSEAPETAQATQHEDVIVGGLEFAMVRARQYDALLRASLEWLRDGAYNGQRNGKFTVDEKGQINREP